MAQWSQEQSDRMRDLWLAGRSAAEVAAIMCAEFDMDVTRNAVIGKVHRWGLGRPATIRLLRPVVVRRTPSLVPLPKERAAPRKERISPITVAPPEPFEGTFSILDVGEGKCKYPIGKHDQLLHSFCCHASGDNVYCEYHTRIATRSPVRRAKGWRWWYREAA